jgi:putative ABC transport system permease protein
VLFCELILEMSYTLTMLWYERQRFLPAVLAVAFSALLIVLQTGLLLGMFSLASLPVDHSSAHLWVAGPGVESVDLAYPIRESYVTRVAAQPEVERCEPLLQGFAIWSKPTGGSELCVVVGARLGAESMGAIPELTPVLRQRLSEPGTVVVDESDLERLGIRGAGEIAEVSEKRVRVVGVLRGMRCLTGAYLFCSLRTAQTLLGMRPDETVYLLARCRDPQAAPAVAKRLRDVDHLSAFTSEDLSLRSRLYWLIQTRGGFVLGFAVALGLGIGMAITTQTLYSATAACSREYSMLRALGIPRWRLVAAVMGQAVCVGGAGVVVAVPVAFAVAWGVDAVGLSVRLPVWLLAATAGVTMSMTLLAGLVSLRSVWRLEPDQLLR